MYGSQTPGSPPTLATNINSQVSQFIADVGGFSDNPAYFISGVVRSCSTIYRDIGFFGVGELNFYTLPTAIDVCDYFWDPQAFSNPAMLFLSGLIPAMQAGKLELESAEAVTIGDVLEEVFGVQFYSGVWQTGGTPAWGGCPVGIPSGPGECISYEGLAGLLENLVVLINKVTDPITCSVGVPHHYSMTPGDGSLRICTIGASNCSTANVYKEQLTHPAPGNELRNTPIRNDEPQVLPIKNPVRYRRSPEQTAALIHVNETEAGHEFHPGTVTRQTVTDDDGIYITTVGAGTGNCKTFNEVIGPAIFKTIDLQIKAHVFFGTTAYHNPIP